MSDHSYDILPTRGRWLLSYSDDKDKDKRNSENNVLTYMGQILQDGENVRFLSFFSKVESSCAQTKRY